MSITDELREWVTGAKPAVVDGCSISVGTMTYGCKKALLAIADRIDAEHQKAILELNNLADASVLLPRDADGVLIRVGDVLDGYGKTIEIVEMRHGRSGWVLISRDGNGYADTFAFSHHHATTVEDVLYESLKHFGAVEERTPEVEDWLHEQARRLQLREVDE